MKNLHHYYSYRSYLQRIFGEKTYKVVVSSGLTCPTRDGFISKKGCGFCDLRGSSSFFGKQERGQTILSQLNQKIPAIQKRFHTRSFLAYFQSYTNTYGPVSYLQQLYESALKHPDIRGLCISTRPDCLPPEVIDLLESFAKTNYLSLELGVQSFEDATLQWLQRGHTVQDSFHALENLKMHAPHVHVCLHFILGCPTETLTTPVQTAHLCNTFQIQGVKLHQLMILKNTLLAERWLNQSFPTLSLEEYAQQLILFLENLSPTIYLERLCATATHPEECLAPSWSQQRWNPHNELRKKLQEKNCRQGAQLNVSAQQSEPTLNQTQSNGTQYMLNESVQ